jgi:hypothetical protein
MEAVLVRLVEDESNFDGANLIVGKLQKGSKFHEVLQLQRMRF